jgi:exodeoxyribonuclease V alpha subunit
VQAEEPEVAVARIVELVKTRIPRRFGFDPIRDIQDLECRLIFQRYALEA